MDDASLYLRKQFSSVFAQSTKTGQNCIFAPSLVFFVEIHILFAETKDS